MYLHCMLLARLLCLQTEERTKIKRMCNTSCKTACASSKPEWIANIFPFPIFLTRCLSRLARHSHRGHFGNRPCRCIPRRLKLRTGGYISAEALLADHEGSRTGVEWACVFRKVSCFCYSTDSGGSSGVLNRNKKNCQMAEKEGFML